MSGVVLRPSRPGEEEALKRLWERVFGDSRAYIDRFFAFYYRPGAAIVAEQDGQIVSAGYRVPMGGMRFPDGTLLKTAMLYALGTDPERRGLGCGTAVTKQVAQTGFDEGYVCNVLCPAEDGLFAYYEQAGYLDCFYLRESEVRPGLLPKAAGTIRPAPAEEYGAVRNRLLSGRLHMVFDDLGLRYQKQLCMETGGDLFLIEGTDFQGCACCEYGEDGTLLVKELLCGERHMLASAALLATVTSARRWLVRTPPDLGGAFGGAVRRFGQMTRGDGDRAFARLGNGYYGFAFD